MTQLALARSVDPSDFVLQWLHRRQSRGREAFETFYCPVTDAGRPQTVPTSVLLVLEMLEEKPTLHD